MTELEWGQRDKQGSMKLGFGLYRSSLTEDHFKFARQVGATHVVVHLTDYFKGANPILDSGSNSQGWGVTTNQGKLWEYEELIEIKKSLNRHDLEWEAIENFDPAHWSDILLDGPQKKKQMEDLKQTIKNIGRAGIRIMGYCFSLAGVWGWYKEPVGRGNAMSVGFDQSKIDTTVPIPQGMVWNMVYDPNAAEGTVGKVSYQEMWQRLEYFLKEIIPIAEENNVRMAIHPDDPPVSELRGTARLVTHPDTFQKIMDLVPSSSNGIELCMGTVQEMQGSNIYEVLEKYARQEQIGYIHFRNVKGKVPNYREVFIDEGDIDMFQALRVLKKNGFDGVIIPDHSPEMSTTAPWHTGHAFSMGYMKAALRQIESEENQ